MNKCYLSLISLFLILSSCVKTIEEEIDVAVEKHKTATSALEGDNTCQAVFDKARLKQDENELCQALIKRTDAELFLCENQITDIENKNLIASCRSQLNQRLAEVQMKRNEGLDQESKRNQRIAFEIQYRDLRKGYTAVTGDVKHKEVILTFDDGPGVTSTYQILKILNQYKIKSHFFMLGSAVQKNPSLAKQVAQQGHSIGNHSYSHPDFNTISFDQQNGEFEQTNDILKKIVGAFDPFFRFPYGSRSREMKSVLNQKGWAEFFWSVDSNDWRKINADGTTRTNMQVINETIRELDKRGRGLVLFHDIHMRTAELLPRFLDEINRKGYKIVLLKPQL